MKLSLLRGRVALRPIVDEKIGSIFLPPLHADWQRKDEQLKGIRAKSSHKATVLGMGLPAIVYNRHELPYGFEVGNVVNYSMQMNEKWSDGQIWEDGEPCIFVAQECINGVIE